MRNGVSWPSASSPRLGLIGNPENRRIRDFQAAVEALGETRPPCLSYEELLNTPERLTQFQADLLRIDSPGENATVARGLIALGGGPQGVEMEKGEIAYLREYHEGFCAVLERIEQRGIPCLNAPREIAVMFDKWASHERFLQQSIPRPRSERAPLEFAELVNSMRERRHGQLFLKPLHGSSGSGVCALRWTPERQQLIAPLRLLTRGNQVLLVNSLRIQQYTTWPEIGAILGRLLPQGMIAEQWIPKLSLPGGVVDLRVLVIRGEARHWVVRQSGNPITNLHLGNRRGDAAALTTLLGTAGWREARNLAERAAACFPESMYAGVDLLLDVRKRAFVGEINAFGDLLPNLLDRGETPFTAIARACHVQGCAL
ncbi:MAG: STM4014 family protein [Verrucomicrobia bacterium]|nr:STM4014 family protein [Verrucomicrobiota bacterium]